MSQRPVGFGPVLLFDDGRHPELPGTCGVDADRRAERPPGEIVLNTNIGRADVSVGPPVAVRGEIISGPFARRREVPLAVAAFPWHAQEGFEAGRAPQIVRALRLDWFGDHET